MATSRINGPPPSADRPTGRVGHHHPPQRACLMAVIATTVTGVFVLVAIIIVGVVATVLPHNSVPTSDALCATVPLRTAKPDATALTRPACAPPRITGTGHGATALAAAARWLGTPYSWGGGGLDGPSRGIDQGANTVGFDCSALTRYAWHQAGVAFRAPPLNNGTPYATSDPATKLQETSCPSKAPAEAPTTPDTSTWSSTQTA
ncbi:peptidoglycan endopeptidase [Nonomuraea diastatica]|uniref:Peptidoglycan endopeptidase n=1 Tax=Nonomuraea diastatica TaxID=1848329 RepID=A0A4R4VW12_9ACTN|nr:peptidoglycan endopeptidase [Nonomuraea diastatica]